MSIFFDPNRRTLTLYTRSTAYQMQIAPLGHLLHLYYGIRTEGCFDYLYLSRDVGFSPNPYELRQDRGWSLDTLPQEYSGSDTGDFRLSSLELRTEDGLHGADLRYRKHEITEGKYALPGLPASFAGTEEAETLTVILGDEATGAEVELLYGVFAEQDVITRAVRVTNGGSRRLKLEKAASLCLDLPFGQWELLHLHGCHTEERQPQRLGLMDGIQTVSSRRGASGHQHDPFVILCRPETTEDCGACYGLMLVYSGSHRTDVELDQTGSVRAVTGINHEGFCWLLEPGESFYTPEVILTFSAQGLTALSHTYHGFIRRQLCPSRFATSPRPLLLNSWETTYFDFDAASVVALARSTRDLGLDMLVLDDGWFGRRTNDKRALGDWFANETRLPGGLAPLIRQIKELGLRFGLWIEPEMISEDSDLYRAHPDWALRLPGRLPAVGRDQLVLDMTRRDVREWLYDTLSALLRDHDIAYVKWDANRSLTDLYSASLPPERQGETAHRYMLGLYELLERLTSEFPQVLFEGCSGGGGRFDAGMLCYFPQIWCSDNTDPVSRIGIQLGASYGYPVSAMANHVSASPNHQTGRSAPLGTRAVAAMSGSFGYELDPRSLSEEEAAECRQQIAQYRRFEELILNGRLYRLVTAGSEPFRVWQFVSPDRQETLVNLIITDHKALARPLHFSLKGLAAEACYSLDEYHFYGCLNEPEWQPAASFSGGALMYGGLTLPVLSGDHPSAQLFFRRIP